MIICLYVDVEQHAAAVMIKSLNFSGDNVEETVKEMVHFHLTAENNSCWMLIDMEN